MMATLGLKEMGKFLWEGREKGLPCWLSQFSKTSSETYPYPKGKHNGAKGPKYASQENAKKWVGPLFLVDNLLSQKQKIIK